jgi:hypothetical protein
MINAHTHNPHGIAGAPSPTINIPCVDSREKWATGSPAFILQNNVVIFGIDFP